MQINNFKKNSIIFKEGAPGQKTYIIKEGKVRILKKEGSKYLELAILGNGSVFGEMSLLDDKPRSATAQAIEDTVVIEIDKTSFEETKNTLPSWLRALINTLVSRFRTMMEANSKKIEENNTSAITHIILLLAGKGNDVDLEELRNSAQKTSGLNTIDTNSAINILISYGLVQIDKQNNLVKIPNKQFIKTYLNYIRFKRDNKVLPGAKLSENAVNISKTILDIFNTLSKKQNDGSVLLPIDHANQKLKETNNELDMNTIEELINAKYIKKLSTKAFGTELMALQFKPQKLLEIFYIKKLLYIINKRN